MPSAHHAGEVPFANVPNPTPEIPTPTVSWTLAQLVLVVKMPFAKTRAIKLFANVHLNIPETLTPYAGSIPAPKLLVAATPSAPPADRGPFADACAASPEVHTQGLDAFPIHAQSTTRAEPTPSVRTTANDRLADAHPATQETHTLNAFEESVPPTRTATRTRLARTFSASIPACRPAVTAPIALQETTLPFASAQEDAREIHLLAAGISPEMKFVKSVEPTRNARSDRTTRPFAVACPTTSEIR